MKYRWRAAEHRTDDAAKQWLDSIGFRYKTAHVKMGGVLSILTEKSLRLYVLNGGILENIGQNEWKTY